MFHVKHFQATGQRDGMEAFQTILEQVFQEAGIPLTAEQARKMAAHYACLTQENSKYNLTAITEPEKAARKHFLDSAMGAALLPRGANVIDVGSGAGFPAVPLKVLRPDISMTAMEATEKKCRFIEAASGGAGVKLAVLHARAEEAGRGEWREAFDVCVSRAVAELPILLELCAPLVKPGGLMIAYKNESAEELEKAAHAMMELRLGLAEKRLPEAFGGQRALLVFQKTGNTDSRYPRKYAQIKKRPL